MNPYERRIIHSEIQKIEGVSTNSIGTENNRKVVVFCENGDKSDSSRRRKTERRNSPKSEDVSNFEREESFDDEYTLDETDLILESADVTTDEDTEDTNE